MIIAVSVLKKLALVESNKVVGLIRACSKLHGQLALREQFSSKDGKELLVFHYKLASDISQSANRIANLLRRCNESAINRGFPPICSDNDYTPSRVIEATLKFMDVLTSESDYELWVDDYDQNR